MASVEENAARAAGDGSVRYYLLIDGIDGGSTAKGFEHAFEIDSFSLDLSQTETSGGGGSGSGSGKTIFGPLEINLDTGAATDELLQTLLSARHIKSVQLLGIATDGKGVGQTVYDLRLGDGLITGIEQSETGISQLAFDYSKISLGTRGADGTFETYGINRATVTELTTPITPPVPASDSGLPPVGDVTWYLTIDGMDGGVTAKGHKGAFALDGFDFDVAMGGIVFGGGGGSGKPSFSPLALQFEFGSAMDEILQKLSQGTHLAHGVQIVGVVDKGKGGEQTVYDLRTDDVIFGYAEFNSRKIDALDLDFGKFSLTTTNKAGVAETYGYNVTGNVVASQLTAPVASSENGLGGGKTTYYLVIDGLDGGSTAKGHKGAFEIDDLEFIAALSGGGSVGGGGGSGKVVFGDVSFTLGAGSASTDLLRLIATSVHTAHAQITGDTQVGGKLIRNAFDMRFQDIQLLDFMHEGKGGDQLSLDFSKYSLTTLGRTGLAETSGFDLQKNVVVTTPLAEATAGTGDGVAAPASQPTFYLMIDGVDGGAGVKGHDQAFRISDFQFGTHGAASTGGVGGGSGKAEFDSLVIDLDLGSAARSLFGLVSHPGVTGRTMQIVAEIPGGKGGSKTVYDLRLGDAFVTDLLDGKQHDQIVVSYDAFSLTTLDGKNKPITYGYDTNTHESTTTPLAAALTANADAVTGPMQYRMLIDGIDGGSTAKGAAGSFGIDDFDFAFHYVDGKRSGELTLSLDIGSAADELLEMIAAGKHIKAFEIIGDRGGAHAADKAYDLRLADVVLTGLKQNSSGDDQLTLAFDKVSLATKNAKGVQATESFDLENNGSLATPIAAPVPGSDSGISGKKTTYYLVIDGLDGGSRDKGHRGAFELGSFDFDVSASHSPSGGGAGSGKASFDALSFTLATGAASDELLKLIATGHHIEAAQIVGDADLGKLGTRTVFDLRLADVMINEFDQGGKDALSLDFGDISLTTLNAKGKAETYEFDLGDYSSSTEQLPPAVADTGATLI